MSNSAFTPAVLTIPAAATTATGELNVISNPSAASLSTTGWTGVTAVGTNSPLNPTVTTAFSIANTAGAESSTSGGYVSFTMPSGLQNKKLKVEFYFTTPATDVYKVSVYKGGSRVTLTTDSSGSTTLPASTTGNFVAYFDSDTTANWTVNITRTSGSTGPIYVTNVIVGPGYVGEKLPFTTRSISAVTTGYTANANALTTLTSGVWIVYCQTVISAVAGITGGLCFISTNSNNDNSGAIGLAVGNNQVASSAFSVSMTLMPEHILVSSNTPIYAKAQSSGANTTITFYGYAIRIA